MSLHEDVYTFKWSDESRGEVEKLRAAGHSSSKIAAALSQTYGVRISRNAVIRQIHRKGQPLQGVPPKKLDDAQMQELRAMCEKRISLRGMAAHFRIGIATTQRYLAGMGIKAHAPAITIRAPRTMRAPVNPAPVPVALTAPISAGVGFFDLGQGMCKWPHGESNDFDALRFCGVNAPEGKSYCRFHHRLAYQPPRTKTDKPKKFEPRPPQKIDLTKKGMRT